MAYSYTLTAVIPASAREIYDAWLDSLAHSEMTGGRAQMSAELGGEFSAFDGYITGRNLEFVPGERIVQSWRTTKFPVDHSDSTLTLTLEERNDGTLLTLAHSNVPEGHVGYEQGGWQKQYFEPMIAYFSGKRSTGGEAQEGKGPRSAAGRPPRRAAQRPARRATLKRRAKKAAKARSRGPATQKKAAASKAKPQRVAARRKSAAKKQAVSPGARRRRVAPKAKKAAAKGRAKPAVRAQARSKRAASTRRRSARRRTK